MHYASAGRFNNTNTPTATTLYATVTFNVIIATSDASLRHDVTITPLRHANTGLAVQYVATSHQY